jgi:hypothetical protein
MSDPANCRRRRTRAAEPVAEAPPGVDQGRFLLVRLASASATRTCRPSRDAGEGFPRMPDGVVVVWSWIYRTSICLSQAIASRKLLDASKARRQSHPLLVGVGRLAVGVRELAAASGSPTPHHKGTQPTLAPTYDTRIDHSTPSDDESLRLPRKQASLPVRIHRAAYTLKATGAVGAEICTTAAHGVPFRARPPHPRPGLQRRLPRGRPAPRHDRKGSTTHQQSPAHLACTG